MKVRDSGMPEQTYWEGLFDIRGVMDGLEVNRKIGDAIEVGCGYGTFTLPVAQCIRGTLHAFDIEPQMVELTRRRAAAAGIDNVRMEARDVVADGFGLAENSVDAVLLFNILHAEDPHRMLCTAADAVRPGGRVLVIHWRSDVPTPRSGSIDSSHAGSDRSVGCHGRTSAAAKSAPTPVAFWDRTASLGTRVAATLAPSHRLRIRVHPCASVVAEV